ncbi:MAG: rRNA maturation RNase YbeY [Rhodothermales bacterium]|nr:rRNA maturation RNase YbeY [Rhodothermales bacterium]
MAETAQVDAGLGDDRIQVWHTHPGRFLPVDRVRSMASGVLKDEGVTPHYVGIVLSRRDRIHEMNREFLDHDYPTDVISFPITEQRDALEGEVYVDLDMAADRAREFGETFRREAARYVVHGLLHLAGHDDATDSQRNRMRVLENRYLSRHWD